MAPIVFLIVLLSIAQAAPTYNNDCSGNRCKHIISMPLLDGLKATLKADLDVSKMNKYLQDFINQEVQTGIQTAMMYAMEEMVDNRTKEIKDRIITLFKDTEKQSDDKLAKKFTDLESERKDAEEQSNVKMAKKLTDFESKFERKDWRYNANTNYRQKYAFFSSLSTAKSNLPDGTIVKFDQVSLNIGNSYDGTTGKFTCHHDGIYTFSWTIVSNPKTDFNSALVLDGRDIAHNIVDNDKVEDSMTGSTTVVVQMKTGQSVWIRAAEPSVNDLRSHWFSGTRVTVFSGFMI